MKTILILLMLVLAGPVVAAQNITTRPDGSVTIRTSINEVTRIAVAGDRIRRLVNDGSQYEMTNDEETGDAFLRFAGQGTPKRETGFIITEAGVTLAYTLIGKTGSEAAETVLITVKGGPTAKAEAAPAPFLSDPGAQAGPSTGGGHANTLAAFMRETIQAHVAGRTLTSGRHGAAIKTINGAGMRARVLVARAGGEATLLRHQSYYKPGVLAVWIAKPALAPRERTHVIVMEKR